MTDTTSQHRWFILFMIIITLFVLIVIVMSVLPEKKTPTLSTLPPPLTTSPPIPAHMVIHQDNEPATQSQLRSTTSSFIKHYIHSVPNELSINHDDIKKIQIASFNFFVYNVVINYDNKSHKFHITILMELPPIKIFVSPVYSEYYPYLNPYIHVIELTYDWRIKKDNVLDDRLRLKDLKIFMVDWEMNRYHNLYLQTKNSPLILKNMPPPLEFSEQDLKNILLQSGLFQSIPAVSSSGFTAHPVETVKSI